MRRAQHLRRSVNLTPNLTALIDVVFLLLIFFMFVTQLARERAVAMTLPSLPDADVQTVKGASILILNVVPADRVEALAGAYRFGLNAYPPTPEGLRALSGALAEARRREPYAPLLLRAQRDERYDRVHPAMQAAILAGFPGVQLVTLPQSRAEGPGTGAPSP